ncbi:ABC transporter ATP-binding protein [Pseudooceanicola sp. CBS1P-1]|uniref:ATP-binding cassette domain-containing protein n=1 Tax=Pseudooceanicola albus TaxID=2692189 RepID=A0A6L7G3V2_9RHOB|nr:MULTISPECIES: ABC transporter ATP-binding protein [Pseudooceanicola]MBT9384880.1 ABC transporter ATP-binding protein [Pseudooceanicola endophyticus]MXN18126.1 ATP-binding cassette domain-containing protein [Pseudooceanicola albus]
MAPILQVKDLRKTYEGGFEALKGINLDIEEGEILALLGPNGAGKTTLISTLCGITQPTSGTATVAGFDIRTDYRRAREQIGLVPQEIHLEPFSYVGANLHFSRGLFGKPRNDALVDGLLKRFSLYDKRRNRVRELSGGMKRRVLIGKALAHEPKVLFLDEPTAGVDVALRKDMWDAVAELKKEGVTIILTTHYIEEAEAMADRVAVIRKGEILMVEQTSELMQRLGRKVLTIELREPLAGIPPALGGLDLELAPDGLSLSYSYDTRAERTGIAGLMARVQEAGIVLKDISTTESTLEEIFVDLVSEGAQ